MALLLILRDDERKRAEEDATRAGGSATSTEAEVPLTQVSARPRCGGIRLEARAGYTLRSHPPREVDGVAQVRRELRDTRREISVLQQQLQAREEQIRELQAQLEQVRPMPGRRMDCASDAGGCRRGGTMTPWCAACGPLQT